MRRLILSNRQGSAGTAAPRPNRPGPLRAALRTLGLTGVLVLMLGGTAAGVGLWGWQTGALGQHGGRIADGLARMSAGTGLAVREVYVSGRKLTDPADLRAAVGVQRGTPILAFDPAAAKARVEDLPWIARAAVIRELPDVVRVRLSERRPLALWQYRGRTQVIDRQGEPVVGAAASRFGRLPLVVGEGAPEHTPEILDILRSQPGLAKRVQAAVRVGNRRWNVRFNNGVDVQLPGNGARAAWARMARLETRHGLLQRDIRAVDLRLPRKLVVRLAPGAEPYSADLGPGEST
jgi:cell division protein FtsQ